MTEGGSHLGSKYFISLILQRLLSMLNWFDENELRVLMTESERAREIECAWIHGEKESGELRLQVCVCVREKERVDGENAYACGSGK